MSGLRIAPGVDLPLDAVTETFGILAKKGAGKSNSAVVMAEEMYAAGVPWVAVDPKGDWWGLRASGDGHGPGLPIVVFGGRHADVPLEPTAGALIADLVLEQNLTCVLDVSEFSKADVRRFLLAFAERLYRQADQEPIHLFLEEAHEYLAQMVRGEDANLVNAWQRIVKQGRFKGLGVTLISQRSAALNKDVLTQVDTLIVLRTTSPQDRAAVKAWVDVHAEAGDMLATLPSLESGEAWLWSPEFLGELKRIRFRRRNTFDSGATPKVGERRRTPATLADVDLAAIKEQMAETIEKAKADDPRELKKQIRELEAANQALAAVPLPEPEIVHVPAITTQVLSDLSAATEPLLELLTQIRDELGRTEREPSPQTPLPGPRQPAVDRPARPAPRVQRAAARGSAPAAGQGPDSVGEVVVPPARRNLLNALVALESIGVEMASRSQVALFAGVSPKSSGFSNNLGAMNTAGLICYPTKGFVQITDLGRTHVGEVPPVATTEALHARVQDLISEARWRIMAPLLAAYPAALDRQELAEAAGVSAASSGYSNNLGALRSLGLLDYPARGLVVATDVLFLEGDR